MCDSEPRAGAGRPTMGPRACTLVEARESIFQPAKGNVMYNIVYIVGAVVIVIAVLSFFGLR